MLASSALSEFCSVAPFTAAIVWKRDDRVNIFFTGFIRALNCGTQLARRQVSDTTDVIRKEGWCI